MEQQVKASVRYPLLIVGSILAVVGLSPLITALLIITHIVPQPETMRLSGMFLSATFFLSVALPSLLVFFLRKRPVAGKLVYVAGTLLLMFGIAFPFLLAMNLPFFIPLSFYLCAATGIWVLLRNK